MSRRVTASAGALILFLALAFTPSGAFAAGTHKLTARPSSSTRSGVAHQAAHPTDPVGSGARRMASRPHAAIVLVPGAGYGRRSGSVQVRALQKRLDRAGFASGPVDGLYGPLTTAAVRRFQQAQGLVVDGLAGPRTFHALRTDVLVPGAGYGQHSGSVQVRALQKRLDRAGFASGPVDGLYGPLTTAAVRRFQQAHGLVVDGLAGPHTSSALRVDLKRASRRTHPVGVGRKRPTPAPRRPAPVPSPLPLQLPARTQRPAVPNLPMTPVLLVLGLLGLFIGVRSYQTVRLRVRSAGRHQRPSPSAGTSGGRTQLIDHEGRRR